MIRRIGFIHTVGFLVEKFRTAMREAHPQVDCFHVLNESLLQDLLRGREPRQVHRRVVRQILLAVDAGADLVAVTCSSTSPAVDAARRLTEVPVLKIDDPMMAEAVRLGRHIGLLCTAASTVAPSTALLRAHALEQERSVEIEPLVLSEAYDALMKGDPARHDALVEAGVGKLRGRLDVLVLAQASLAHLRDRLSSSLAIPVLASPDLLMKEIARSLDAGSVH